MIDRSARGDLSTEDLATLLEVTRSLAAPFDLIFADPPYAAGAGNGVVASVEQAGWLAPGGWLAIETARGDRVEPGALRLDAERDTGPARLTLLQG